MELSTKKNNELDKENNNNKLLRSAVVRSLAFTPLKFSLLKQDILEAANEPLSTVRDILEIEDDKEEEESSISQNKKASPNKLSLSNNLCTKISEMNRHLYDSDTVSSNIKYLFTENTYELKNVPKEDVCISTKNSKPDEKQSLNLPIKENKIQTTKHPRIQCSINMNSVLKTPSNNFRPLKPSFSSGKFQTPIKYNGTTYRHLNGDILKIDKMVGSVKKDNNLAKTKEIENLTSAENIFPFKTIIINNKTYILFKELGKGGSSVVYSAFDIISMDERAIKKVVLNKTQPSSMEFINEIEILKKLQNCNRIITMYDSEVQNNPTEEDILWVVLEKGGMDLGRILKSSKPGKPLELHVIMFYWMEMLYAVKQIHENGIIHSDLKPANFIMAGTSLKLIDFGIASCIQSDMTSVYKNVAVGSFEYISPEALLNDNKRNCSESPSFGKPKYKISFKSDVWSLGCILYQLVFGKTPFHNIRNVSAKVMTIMDPNHEIIYPPCNYICIEMVETIKKCLRYNVKERPSVGELIQCFKR